MNLGVAQGGHEPGGAHEEDLMRTSPAGPGSVRRRTLVHVRLPTGDWLAGWFEAAEGKHTARLHVNLSDALEMLGADPSELLPIVDDELIIRLPAGTVIRSEGTGSSAALPAGSPDGR